MTTYLLDVNLLLALADPWHIHYEAANRWFAAEARDSWATCPITENGFLRIASHPNYPNRPGDVLVVAAILRQWCEEPAHQFWADDVSILDLLDHGAIITHSQITDVYLLGLAVGKKGKLATLDQRIPAAALRGGRDALEIVPG